MSLHRLFAIARKEFHHVTRDARTLFLVTIAPAFLLFTLAYVFSMDAEHFSLIVLDQDKTPLSRQYVVDLTSDGTFQVMAYVGSYAEIDAWLQAGRANAALVIPPGTADAVHARRPAPVQAILDGVDAIAAGQAVGQLNARTMAFAMTLLPQVNGRTPGTLDLRSVAWYNPPQKSLVSMVPGLMALVLVMPALALSLSLTREKELGSFERLAATPIRGLEYLLGKLLTTMGFGLVSALPMLLVAILWFRVPFRGNLFVFLALACCYLLASEGVSVLVANFVKSQQTAMLIVILVFFVPSFFLAGLILPVDKSSIVSSAVAFALPASHFIVIARGVFLKGLSIGDLVSPSLTLLVMGGGTVILGLALFRKWIA
jgi:ABC-type multidrug transport system permease subunit